MVDMHVYVCSLASHIPQSQENRDLVTSNEDSIFSICARPVQSLLFSMTCYRIVELCRNDLLHACQ